MKRKIIVDINAAVLVDDTIYFTLKQGSRLFGCKLDSNRAFELGTIPWENRASERLYDKIIYNKGKLYLIPFAARFLTVYNIRNRLFEQIDVKRKAFSPFRATVSYGDRIITFGSSIILIECKHSQYYMTKIDDWKSFVAPYVFNYKDICFRNQLLYEDERVLIPFCNANAILQLDIETLKTKVFKLGEENNGYSGIAKSKDGTFWLSPRYTGMDCVRCDTSMKVIDRIQISSCGIRETILGIAVEDDIPCLFTNYERVNGVVKQRNNCLLLESSRIEMGFNRTDKTLYIIDDCGNELFNSKIYFDEDLSNVLSLGIVIEDRHWDIGEYISAI